MHYTRQLLFFVFIALIPAGLILKLQDIRPGAELAALGLALMLGFFLFRLFSVRPPSWKNISTNVIFILMIVTIFSKYFYHRFWDIPTLIIVPLFIGLGIFLLIKGRFSDAKLGLSTLMLLMLTIPLFISLPVLKEPGKYIPAYWNANYDVTHYVKVKDPMPIAFAQTKQLMKEASLFKKLQEYDSATVYYQGARQLEPANTTVLFDMSDCYAQMDNLRGAIALLDTAITIDDSYAPFFINRGLYFYKLFENRKAIDDYNHAIELDPRQPVVYLNLALVEYYENDFDKACEAIRKLDELGFDYSDQKEVLEIKAKHCQ